MRQEQYRLEKQKYAKIDFIMKNDKKYKIKHPNAYRFHIFMKFKIMHFNKETNIIKVLYNNEHQLLKLQNMDGFFYFNENRRSKIEDYLKKMNM